MNKEEIQNELGLISARLDTLLNNVGEGITEDKPEPETAFQGIVREALKVGNCPGDGKPWDWIVKHYPNMLAIVLSTFNATVDLAIGAISNGVRATEEELGERIEALREPIPD